MPNQDHKGQIFNCEDFRRRKEKIFCFNRVEDKNNDFGASAGSLATLKCRSCNSEYGLLSDARVLIFECRFHFLVCKRLGEFIDTLVFVECLGTGRQGRLINKATILAY